MSRAERKQESRRRIIEAARRLFKEHGYEGVGVATVMEAAGLTHGAFYAHFPSKAALFEATMADTSFSDALRRRLDRADDKIAALIDLYLSEHHRNDYAHGCVVAALGGTVAQGPEEARPAMGAAVKGMIAAIARLDPAFDQGTAAALAAELVGGLVLARAIDDPETSASVLAACRSGARCIVERHEERRRDEVGAGEPQESEC